MREAFFFCVLVLLFSVSSSPLWSDFIISEQDYKVLLTIIDSSRKELQITKSNLQTYKAELEASLQVLNQLQQDLEKMNKESRELLAILDRQERSLKEAVNLNNAIPWIAGGCLVAGVIIGILIGANSK